MSNVFISGNRVFLREFVPSDLDAFVRWHTQGEWRQFDAPWEESQQSLTESQQTKVRQRFLEACAEETLAPRKSAIITTRKGEPIGWVIRHAQERFHDAWMVGIDICEDRFLNGGLGTEALRLWVDYLFANSNIERIGLDTWSFNQRMIRVAEKVGFMREGSGRRMKQWQGQWLDWVHFGMLREEWEQQQILGIRDLGLQDSASARREAVRSPATIEIVKAEESDIQDIGKLWWEFYLFHHNLNPVFPLPDDPITSFVKNHLIRFMASDDGLALVARHGARTVGYAMTEVRRHPPEFKREPYGYIDQMVVTEEFRRKGVGEKLLAEIANWCHSNNIRRLELGTDAKNAVANSFWTKHGFVVHSHTLFKDI